jgi:membrane-bound lytic murein transglycosylase A
LNPGSFCRLIAAAVASGLLFGCAEQPPSPKETANLFPVAFADLPGWTGDDPSAALAAFQRSCAVFAKSPEDAAVGPQGIGGRAKDWRTACSAIPTAGSSESARDFFEHEFTPYSVTGAKGAGGLFTGYYEPELTGSRQRSAEYGVPLYRRPADLVMADLGEFRADLAGNSIAGRVVDGRLKSYSTRAEIDAGALAGQGLELLWVADPVDAFFLQVQGSGRIQLAEGGTTRVGFAANNGHGFVSVGRILVDEGKLTKDQATAQTVAQWLKDHPAEGAEIMARNPRFIFFREIEGDGPVGAQGIVLTPERSMAVDGALLPLGAPVWIDTTWPGGTGQAGQPLQRLMVAQDVGGAIKGAVRGDLFWGTGAQALEVAGRLKQPGRYFILLPKTVTIPAPAS